MMTNATYEALLGGALAQVEKLRAFGVCSEDIVFVMTKDVYQFANATEVNLTTNYQVEALTVKAKLYGYDIGIIDEPVGKITETTFTAASKRMDYRVGMEVGDMIIVDDDGKHRLYLLDFRPTACFLDTGRTVRFEQVFRMPCVTNTVNDAIRGNIPYRFNSYAPYLEDGLVVPTVYGFRNYTDLLDSLIRSVDWLHAGRTTAHKKRESELKESKLTPEDTKELDDFLNSFVVKPAT